MVRIDEKKLILLLEENSRARAVALAKKLRVTETAVRKRIQKLIEEGVIERFTILTNPARLGEKEVHIGIDTEPETYLELLSELKRERVVKRLFTASGDHMIMVICRFSSQGEAEQFIIRLEEQKGVTKVCPAFINERLK